MTKGQQKRMRILQTTLRGAVLAVSILGLQIIEAGQGSLADNARLQQIIATDWEYELQHDPEMATAIGDNRFNDRLSDQSPAAYTAQLAHDEAVLHDVVQVNEHELNRQDALNRALFVRMLQTRIEGERLKNWEMPVNQMNAPPLSYPALPKEMPFKTVRDYENYNSRLSHLPELFSQVMECMRGGMADGLMPPRYLLEKATLEIQDIANRPVDQSSFSKPVQQFPDTISKADAQRLSAELKATIAQKVLPAYVSFARFMRDEYAPKGRSDFGAWSLPDGEVRYRHAIREMTTTDRTPDELHRLGMQQVDELEKQMLALARKQGYPDLPSFNKHIFSDRKLYGTSGEQIFSLYARYTDGMYAKLPQYFGRLPKNKLAVVPMDEYRAPQAVPADYSIGAGDNSRPGRINVNEYEPTRRLLLNVEAIAYHEGIPGHHLQFSIAQELTGVPPFRRFAGSGSATPNYNSYSEGWALYSETLAHEMGFYQDPYSEYGRLQNLMWRSIRLVVDTGVHSQHWTRQEMIDYFHQHTAMDDQNIETEVDRYIAWPAQALGYKLGEMTILQLRERARQELGAKFDIRQFHDAVLTNGPLPLDVLTTEVGRWIATKSGKTSATSN